MARIALDGHHDIASAAKMSPHLDADTRRQALSNLSLLAFLDVDPRPTFILDVLSQEAAIHSASVTRPAYCNNALLAKPGLNERVSGRADIEYEEEAWVLQYMSFRQWLLRHDTSDNKSSAHYYEGYTWCASLVQNRWIIVSGLDGLCPSQERSMSYNDGTMEKNALSGARDNVGASAKGGAISLEAVDLGVAPSITRARMAARLEQAHSGSFRTQSITTQAQSPHMQLFLSLDWSRTSLGPMDNWSPQLQAITSLVLTSLNPIVLFWGSTLSMIYNEAYARIIQDVHPKAFGASAYEIFGKNGNMIMLEPFVKLLQATRRTHVEQAVPFFLRRNGRLEEVYYDQEWIPIQDERGEVIGILEPVTETTKALILERRLSSLIDIASHTAEASSIEMYWTRVAESLALHERDFPFALVYAIENECGEASPLSTPSGHTPRRCAYKGGVGVDKDHPIVQDKFDLLQATDGLAPYFRTAAISRKMLVLDCSKESNFPVELLDGIQWRGHGEPCTTLLTCPIIPTTSENVQGFVLLGLNQRWPCDDDVEQFAKVLTRLFATSLASVFLFEEEIRQRERLIKTAAIMQEEVEAKLQIARADLEIEVGKFKRFAEKADVAVFIANAEGKYTYRNQAWYDIFYSASEDDSMSSIITKIANPDDVVRCQKIVHTLMIENEPVSFELETSQAWRPSSESLRNIADIMSGEHHVWILCSAYAELDADGNVRQVVGCVTDISRQKWAEGLERQRVQDALESKRQLENFIDTTSHEMRNPLSAIVQCADGIISSYSSLTKLKSNHQDYFGSETPYQELVDSGLDAAETIVQCSQHMKRIVDDVLTISKLDSGLLVMTPVDTHPSDVALHAVKMFHSEAKAADIDLAFEVDRSYSDANVDLVSLDPTRLLQVLINLITNAIKFTRSEKHRSINVSVGASTQRPDASASGVPFIRTGKGLEDAILKRDWDEGENIYVQFAVRDTGRGLSAQESALLFAKFAQGSPRTHISYGGSGLGLFISRQLSEMQGGAIGFTSKQREGSTFSFYVRARRSDPQPPSTLLNGPVVYTTEKRTATEDSAPRPGTAINTRAAPSSQSLQQAAEAELSTLRKTRVHPDIPGEAMAAAPMQTLPIPAKPVPGQLRVLVVEDNLVNQRVLANQLGRLGCTVHVANHGLEALEFLKTTKYHYNTPCSRAAASSAVDPTISGTPPTTPPETPSHDLDFILMDWEMPVMDGLTCVREIRKLQSAGTLSAHIPVVAVTANVRLEQIATAIEAGMDDVVSKPFRVPDLLGRVRSLIAEANQDSEV